jgi:hypothetical protein
MVELLPSKIDRLHTLNTGVSALVACVCVYLCVYTSARTWLSCFSKIDRLHALNTGLFIYVCIYVCFISVCVCVCVCGVCVQSTGCMRSTQDDLVFPDAGDARGGGGGGGEKAKFQPAAPTFLLRLWSQCTRSTLTEQKEKMSVFSCTKFVTAA